MAGGFQRQEFFAPASGDTGAQQRFMSLVAEMERFRDNAERLATPFMAEAGARAGAEAGANREGGTKLPVGPYKRAYNDAFLRSYTLDVYADTEEDFLRLEQDAKGDPDLFMATATKRRDAILAEVKPETAAYVRMAIDERIGSARTRLTQQSVERATETARMQTLRGLGAMSRDASRLFSSGQPADIKKAEQLAGEYFAQLDAAVADGLLSPTEGGKLTEQALQANAWDLEIGRFQTALETPGGNPVAIIRETMKAENPLFNDEKRQQLVSEMYRRLGQAHSLAQAEAAAVKAGRMQLWEDTEKEATLRLLNGTLNRSWLAQQVRESAIDPQLARTLMTSEHGTGVEDDPDAVLNLQAHWRRMSIPDLLALPGLSDKTRAAFVGRIATREADWRDSDEYQEGSRTIARELGVSLENLALADQETKTLLNLAMTKFDRDLEGMPEEERIGVAVPKADEIVRTVLRGETAKKLQTAKLNLQRFLDTYAGSQGARDIGELSPEERAAFEEKKKRKEAEIAKLEAELAR